MNLSLKKPEFTISNISQSIILEHNEKLWEKYRNGNIKAEELRWKSMWNTLSEFRIADENLARHLGNDFLNCYQPAIYYFPTRWIH